MGSYESWADFDGKEEVLPRAWPYSRKFASPTLSSRTVIGGIPAHSLFRQLSAFMQRPHRNLDKGLCELLRGKSSKCAVRPT
jgi:hypothetical protein